MRRVCESARVTGDAEMKPAMFVVFLGLLAAGIFVMAGFDPAPAEAETEPDLVTNVKSPGVYIN